MSIARKLQQAQRREDLHSLKKTPSTKIDTSTTVGSSVKSIFNFSYSVKNISSTIVTRIGDGARYIVRSINNRTKDLQKIIYYTVYFEVVGMCSAESLATIGGLGMSGAEYTRTKANLIANEKSCWRGVDPEYRNLRTCVGNPNLEREFQNASHAAAYEVMPSLNAFALNAMVVGGAAGAVAGFLFGLLKVLNDHRILEMNSRKLAAFVERIDATLHGDIFPVVFGSSIVTTYMLGAIANIDEVNQQYFHYIVTNANAYPKCDLNYAASHCQMITCPDSKMKIIFCDAAIDFVKNQLPLMSMRQLPMIVGLSVALPTLGFLRKKERMSIEDKSEKKEVNRVSPSTSFSNRH